MGNYLRPKNYKIIVSMVIFVFEWYNTITAGCRAGSGLGSELHEVCPHVYIHLSGMTYC